MDKDTEDFLSNLLLDAKISYREENKKGEDSEDRILECTIHDFSDNFKEGVRRFCKGFREYLDSSGFDTERLEQLSRSFGGSVYLSLSGAGAGFFDEYTHEDPDIGDDLHKALKEYSAKDYRFEGLNCMLWFHEGLGLDLCYKAKYLDEFHKTLFEGTKRYEQHRAN